MNKINLMDVDFLIPIRIDSIARIENLLASIGYLIENFDTNIYILEASSFNNHILEKNLPDGVAYFFLEDLDPIFHRTKYINLLEKKGIGDYIAIWDADVLIDYHQIVDAVMSLRAGIADVSFPYDGHFYDTTPIIRNVYLESSDFSVLSNNINKMMLPYGTDMGGGGIFIRRDNFNTAGGEDETFYGWGVEDWNRIEKWKKFGYKIKKTDGPLFHLSHPRDINGKFNSEWQSRYVFNTLNQTQYGSLDEIRSRMTPIKINSTRNKKKLHIGCRGSLLPSWINTDTKLYSDEVLYLDLTKPLPFIDDSFEYVFVEHICDQVNYDIFLSSLRELYRIIKPGGVFRVAIPSSLDLLMNLYHEPNMPPYSQYINWTIENFTSKSVNYNYLDIQDLAIIAFNIFMQNNGSKFIYNAKIIKKILFMAGFKHIKKHSIGQSDYKVLRNLERFKTKIPMWINKLEMDVFEAGK